MVEQFRACMETTEKINKSLGFVVSWPTSCPDINFMWFLGDTPESAVKFQDWWVYHHGKIPDFHHIKEFLNINPDIQHQYMEYMYRWEIYHTLRS